MTQPSESRDRDKLRVNGSEYYSTTWNERPLHSGESVSLCIQGKLRSSATSFHGWTQGDWDRTWSSQAPPWPQGKTAEQCTGELLLNLGRFKRWTPRALLARAASTSPHRHSWTTSPWPRQRAWWRRGSVSENGTPPTTSCIPWTTTRWKCSRPGPDIFFMIVRTVVLIP